MIVCKKCGNQNPDGETFCTSCRAFLEWSGEKITEAPPPAPPPPPAPVAQPDLIDRVKQAVGLDQPKEQVVQAPQAMAGPPPPAAAVSAGPPPPPAPIVEIPRPEPTAVAAPTPPPPPPIPVALPMPPPYQPAMPQAPVAPMAPAAGAVPVAGVVPRPADIPAARLPQAVAPAPERPRQAPKTDVTTGQRYKPGDLICGNCGAGNSPERHFCQRCGSNLTAAVVVKTPWYRKLLPARRLPAAGTRPSSAPTERAWGSALVRVIALGVVVAVVLAYAAVPPLRARVNNSVASIYASAHRHFQPTVDPVRPLDATASSALATHPARLTIDEVKESYWAANTASDKQPWLRLTFSGPVDIDKMLITSGAANDFATLARPKAVHIVFSDKTTADLTLKDDPTPQSYDLTARQVTSLEIHIVSVYPSAQSPDVALNEVELFNVK